MCGGDSAFPRLATFADDCTAATIKLRGVNADMPLGLAIQSERLGQVAALEGVSLLGGKAAMVDACCGACFFQGSIRERCPSLAQHADFIRGRGKP